MAAVAWAAWAATWVSNPRSFIKNREGGFRAAFFIFPLPKNCHQLIEIK
jgi:hypothetical protein